MSGVCVCAPHGFLSAFLYVSVCVCIYVFVCMCVHVERHIKLSVHALCFPAV